MAALVLKNVPAQLHRRLKQEATRHRRSMTQEAIVLLEQSLGGRVSPARLDPAKPPVPVQLRNPSSGRTMPMTQAMLRRAIRQGRA
jgi:plasmid stability protein